MPPSQLYDSLLPDRPHPAIRPASGSGAANRISPEPDPSSSHRSEEPEDKCVSNISHRLQYLHHIRFTKACRQKARWINIAICFGVDLQEIFKTGIRSDLQDMDADDVNNAADSNM
jgi:hypothetical protein